MMQAAMDAPGNLLDHLIASRPYSGAMLVHSKGNPGLPEVQLDGFDSDEDVADPVEDEPSRHFRCPEYTL